MITIENLCKAYNDKILFKNFHLKIPDSSFLVISGESGCGKSTLLNMIGGIENPDKGSCIRPLSAAIRAAFSGQTGPY